MPHPSRSTKSHLQQQITNKQNKQNHNLINLKPSKSFKPIHPKPLAPTSKQTSSHIQPLKPQQTPLLKQSTSPASLKKLYSQQTAECYLKGIMGHLCGQSESSEKFLEKHSITPSLRSKMVDWIIEVLSSYKMHEDSFFRAIKLMDTFLLRTSIKHQASDLHLLGMTAMFSACKYQQIHPIKLETFYEKIGRKKFSIDEILSKQSILLQCLNFRIEEVNVYELVKNTSFVIDLNLDKEKLEYLDQILLYLAKMSLFSYQLAQLNAKSLASAVYYIALKTLEQNQPSLNPQYHLQRISELLDTPEDTILTVSRQVLDLAKNFSTIYPSLGNLKKFNKFQLKKSVQ